MNPLSWEAPPISPDMQTGRSRSLAIINGHPDHPPSMESPTPKRKKKAAAKPPRKRSFARSPTISDLQTDDKEPPDSAPLVESMPFKKKKKATSKRPAKQVLGNSPASKNLQSGGTGLSASCTDPQIDIPGHNEHPACSLPVEPSPSKKKKTMSKLPCKRASGSPPEHQHPQSSGVGLLVPDNEDEGGYTTPTESSSPVKKNTEVTKPSPEQACGGSSECNRPRIKIIGPKQPGSPPLESKVVYF